MVLWNRGAEQLFGWGAAEIEGSACPLVTSLNKDVWAAISMPGLNSHEQILTNHDGTEHTLRISTAALDGQHSNADGMIMLLEDVTEKTKLQTEADRGNRLASLGQLAVGVAHEINNPNGLILLNMPTLQEAGELLVTEALERACGNQTIASTMLGISRPALSKGLKKSQNGLTS